MKRAIPRYGVRYVAGSVESGLRALKEGRGVQGPEIRQFEELFADYHHAADAISASYGRMAFYYILRALDLPPGSEVIFPALTFWVIPEIARICGLHPVFVDIDPRTFNMDPARIEGVLSSRTRAVVPTHIYGQPCDMSPIIGIARKHNLVVIEDCAHALGATYQDRKTGTFGDAAFFSFQMLKGLNAYGGGMAITNDLSLANKIRNEAEKEPWPNQSEIRKRIMMGQVIRALTSSTGFSFGLFVPFYINSIFGNRDISYLLWEKIRPLNPLPESYRRRFSNAQAIIGLKGLEKLDEFNARSRANAERLTRGLCGARSILTPGALPETVSTFYQYCIRTSNPKELSRYAIRRGIDIEIMHVDICSELPLFSEFARSCPHSEGTKNTLQLPVYANLSPNEIDRILGVIRKASEHMPPVPESIATLGSS